MNALYADLNHRYWGGRLPAYRIRRDRAVASPKNCARGDVNHHSRIIRLHPTLVGDDLRTVLLHEMAHISEPSADHG